MKPSSHDLYLSPAFLHLWSHYASQMWVLWVNLHSPGLALIRESHSRKGEPCAIQARTLDEEDRLTRFRPSEMLMMASISSSLCEAKAWSEHRDSEKPRAAQT